MSTLDDFTDAVASRVALGDATRLTGGLGLVVGSERVWAGGTLSLRGSLDLGRILTGAATSVEVSGETLSSEAPNGRVLAGLAGTWRRGHFSLSTALAADGPGSGDVFYAGRLTLGLRFWHPVAASDSRPDGIVAMDA